MVYSDSPPYDILKNDLIDFELMQDMKRFARFWDIVYNSGNFQKSCELLFKDGKVFENFLILVNGYIKEVNRLIRFLLIELQNFYSNI